MKYLYVEKVSQWELEDKIDEILMECQVTVDKSRNNMRLLKIGAGFDTETSKIPLAPNKYNLNHVSYCYHWQFGLHDTAFMGRSLNTMLQFLQLLQNHIIHFHDNAKILVLDANLGYEWQFCKHYWATMGIGKVFAKESRNPLMIEVGDCFIFREVIGLFGSSLSQIAKNYCGMEKLIGDLDYDKIRLSNTEMTDAEIGYCIRDVEILCKLCESHIYENYYGRKNRMPYTKTGMVRDEIKQALGKYLRSEKEKISSWMPSEDVYEIFRIKLFKGGISGSNILKIGRVWKDVIGADITSDYPFQIMSKLFPMGRAVKCPNGDFLKEDKPYIAHVKFFRFRSRTCHALMSAHKAINITEMRSNDATILDNNRIQYAESVELLLNDVEYKSLKKAYKWEHAIIRECWKFPMGYQMLPRHIRDTCKDWYLKKQSLKEHYSDTIDYLEAKQFVNSIFGMMCTALYREEYVFNKVKCCIMVKEDEEGMKVTNDYYDCCKELYLSPYWGFWITSYAREMLMDVICKFPRVIIQYDTDSVYYISGSQEADELEKYLNNYNERRKRINNIRFKDPLMETLGTWDFTKPFKRFKCLGSKRYIYEKYDGSICCVVTGCRSNPETKRSTILDQLEFNNSKDGTNIDVFEFFRDGMRIDKEHSRKLAPTYVEKKFAVNCKNEKLFIPSCVVLEPIEFNMGMSESHKTLAIAVQRLADNTKDKAVYDLWRSIKSSSSIMIPISESTTIGNSSQKSTENWEYLKSTI